jgi:hypothetical protein
MAQCIEHFIFQRLLFFTILLQNMCYILRVVIALTQWKSEIEKFCERNALSICTYHGSDRVKNTPRKLIKMYDIVLTTYQVLEADFRKMVSPNKVKVSFFHSGIKFRKKIHWIAFNSSCFPSCAVPQLWSKV